MDLSGGNPDPLATIREGRQTTAPTEQHAKRHYGGVPWPNVKQLPI